MASEPVDWRTLRLDIMESKGAPGPQELDRFAALLSRRDPLTLEKEVPLPGVASPLELVQAAVIRRCATMHDPTLRSLIDQVVRTAHTRYLEYVRDR